MLEPTRRLPKRTRLGAGRSPAAAVNPSPNGRRPVENEHLPRGSCQAEPPTIPDKARTSPALERTPGGPPHRTSRARSSNVGGESPSAQRPHRREWCQPWGGQDRAKRRPRRTADPRGAPECHSGALSARPEGSQSAILALSAPVSLLCRSPVAFGVSDARRARENARRGSRCARRSRLKIHRWKRLVGSSPTSGTTRKSWGIRGATGVPIATTWIRGVSLLCRSGAKNGLTSVGVQAPVVGVQSPPAPVAYCPRLAAPFAS